MQGRTFLLTQWSNSLYGGDLSYQGMVCNR
jgi:hypothetical protein